MNDAAVLGAVAAQHDAVLVAVRFVHAHPELGHEERECSAYLAAVLERAGFEVELGIAGMETAFRAVLRGARPGRSVGLACLYDAVATVRPDGSIDAVHSCGHGPIAGGVAGAALALASLQAELPGALVVVGCPADEIHAPGTRARGGGKLLTAAAGVWDGLDAALYAHPEFDDTVTLVSRWLRRERLLVSGTRSLAGVPQAPVDAVHMLLHALGSHSPADVVLEHVELDGDVEEGTGFVLRAEILVFADGEKELDERCAALRERVPGGWSPGPTVQGVRPDPAVTAAVRAAFLAAGRSFRDDPDPLPFATDFGNVSQRVPAALVGVGRPGGWRFHADEGAQEFASQAGEEAALTIARVLALAATRLLEPA